MAFSDQQLLHYFSRMPLVDTAEWAHILGEPHATIHRALTSLVADGIAGRVSHGTAQLPLPCRASYCSPIESWSVVIALPPQFGDVTRRTWVANSKLAHSRMCRPRQGESCP